MSIAAITTNLQSYTPSTTNIAQAFKQLSQDVGAGNLAAAQQDYVTLQSQLTPSTSATSSVSSVDQSAAQKLFAQLGTDLSAGKMSAAQQDLAAIKDQLQLATGTSQVQSGGHHHRADSDVDSSSSTSATQKSPLEQMMSQLDAALNSGDLSAAQSAFATLQQNLPTAALINAQTNALTSGISVNTYV